MEAKTLRKVRESFGRCTLKKGFYDELLKNLSTGSFDSENAAAMLDHNQQRQLLKNDIAFLLLAAGEQQSGKIALARLVTQKGKSMLPSRHDQLAQWIEALLAAVKIFDHRFDSETENGWREAVESGLKSAAGKTS